ncbi:choice-of-anchor E domain-containing protein [Alteromonas sp.]|jgi:hypothetical protein|uniref:choice-of-anchor E domain-containing protein n=1 Tax=Alteromonas sp. TaxID=232 RepID=UPI003AE04C71
MNKRIIAAAIIAATTMPIKAAIITQEVSFGEQGSPFDVAEVSPLSESVFIDAFDQTLGTLNAVNITVYGQIDSEGRSVNGSSEAGRTDVDIFLASNWQVSSSVADTFVFEQANFVNPLVSAQSSPEGTFTMIPGEDSAEFEFDVTTGERSGMLANVDLSAFLAGTPIEFLFSTDARTNLFNQVDGGTGSFTNEFSTGSWGKVFVEFDYAPTVTSVSEPAAFSLFGAGLLFLLSNRRKLIKK